MISNIKLTSLTCQWLEGYESIDINSRQGLMRYVVIIDSDNDLLPNRHQAITWTSAHAGCLPDSTWYI